MEELMANPSIAARKKLSALYVRGVAVRFGQDGAKIADPAKNGGRFPEDEPLGEDDVEVWISAINPHQREMAMREAQAARARSLLKLKTDPNSEEYLTTRAYLADMSLETLIDYLIMSDQESRLSEAMRAVLAEKEWENFDELRDAMRQYEEAVTAWDENPEGPDPREDPEWTSLLEAEARYAKQVNDKEHELRSAAQESMRLIARGELENRAAEKRSEIVGSQAFVGEYEDQMRYYSVRDPDKRDVLFFESVRDYREAPEVVQDGIGRALQAFIREGSEAKN